MAVGAPSDTDGAERIVVRHTDGRVNLDGSTNVHLSAGVPSISGREKLGADLKIDFESGDSLLVEDFFVSDDQGDFSRLLSATDDLLASGLQAPEPALQADEDVTEVYPAGERGSSEQTAADDADAGGLFAVDGGGDAGADWFDPFVMTGAGLASGLSLFDFEGGQHSDAGASAGQSTEAEADLDDESIADLLGVEDAVIDLEGTVTGVEDALQFADAPEDGMVAEPLVTDGTEAIAGFVAVDGGAMIDMAGGDLLAELGTEIDL